MKVDLNTLTNNRKVLHGIIQIKQAPGEYKYSLVEEKQKPLKYLFNLQPKTKNPNPTNLTNELERVRYLGEDFETYFDEHPNLSRTVGSLPQKWGRIIGNNPQKREAIDKAFTVFAQKFNEIVTNPETEFLINSHRQQLGNELSKILNQDVKVTQLAQGYWGATYKITADNQNYVLKCFYKKSPKIKGRTSHCSGNYEELAAAIYSSKNAPDHFAPFYMGRFGENLDGYILTKFLPENAKYRKFNGLKEFHPRNFVFLRYIQKLRSIDINIDNFAGKRIIDFGHCLQEQAAHLNGKTYSILHTLCKFIDTNNEEGLRKIISKYAKTSHFQEAKDYIKYIINKYSTLENISQLKMKSHILEKLGLDYVPDIRYFLEKTTSEELNYNSYKISRIYNIPEKDVTKLWEKYFK